VGVVLGGHDVHEEVMSRKAREPFMPLRCPALEASKGMLDQYRGTQRWCGSEDFRHLARSERSAWD